MANRSAVQRYRSTSPVHPCMAASAASPGLDVASNPQAVAELENSVSRKLVFSQWTDSSGSAGPRVFGGVAGQCGTGCEHGLVVAQNLSVADLRGDECHRDADVLDMPVIDRPR